MENKLNTPNLSDFAIYIQDCRRNDVQLNDRELVLAMRSFCWFIPGYEFSDLRSVCEKVLPVLLEHKDLISISGIPQLLDAYLNDSDLDTTGFTSIVNSIPMTVQAETEYITKTFAKKKIKFDKKLFKEFLDRFVDLKDTSQRVAYIIGNCFEHHLKRLSVIEKFDSMDKENILSAITMNLDRCKSDEVKKFLENALEWENMNDRAIEDLEYMLESWDEE